MRRPDAAAVLAVIFWLAAFAALGDAIGRVFAR